METGWVVNWRIENLSHWCKEVHGECIKSPEIWENGIIMELYPKGISGTKDHLMVRLWGVKFACSGDLSIHLSEGHLLYKQQVKGVGNKDFLELTLGPKFNDVLARIREGEDLISVKLRINDTNYSELRICTTINVFRTSLKINPAWIEKMESGTSKKVCSISFSPDTYFDRMELNICFKPDRVYLMIKPPTQCKYPFAVEMRVSLTRSDGNVNSCVKKENVFRDNRNWMFPDPLDKKELVGKGISLLLCLKTRNVIQNLSYLNYNYRNVSIEPINTPCFSTKEPSTDPVTNKMAVSTKDFGSQTSLTFNMPDDSVLLLTKELMCLYQDQDFSDINLKCENVSFPVHRNILSARSPVFKTMLSIDMKEASSSEVVIGDIDPSTLSRFLTYLYTGSVEEEMQSDRAVKLYYVADKYQVPSLKRECSEFLCSNVSISNVCDILSLAVKHLDDELTAASHDFLLDNYNEVLKSKEWEGFMGSEPLLALKTLTKFAAKDCVFVRKHDSK